MNDADEMCNIEVEFGYDPKYFDEFARSNLLCQKPSPDFSFCDQPGLYGEC